jgi:hypothetical protein
VRRGFSLSSENGDTAIVQGVATSISFPNAIAAGFNGNLTAE